MIQVIVTASQEFYSACPVHRMIQAIVTASQGFYSACPVHRMSQAIVTASQGFYSACPVHHRRHHRHHHHMPQSFHKTSVYVLTVHVFILMLLWINRSN